MRVRAVAGVAIQQLDDEATLLHPTGGSALTLNATALAIWSRCAAPIGVDALVAALADEYGVTQDAIDGHVRATVQQLVDLGYAERV